MKKMLAILCSFLTPILSMHARGTNPLNGSSSLGQGTNPASTAFRYNIGDFAQGGVVIWVTTDGQHGLVAAIEDQGGAALQWSIEIDNEDVGAAYNNPLPTATPIAPYGQYYGGYLNQQTIEAQNLSAFPAFQAAADYSITVNGITYSDWFLPSYRELLLMYSAVSLINQVSIANGGQAMRTVATVPNSEYWSSRQGVETSTSGQYGSWMITTAEDNSNPNVNGVAQNNKKRNDLLYVRCVRAF